MQTSWIPASTSSALTEPSKANMHFNFVFHSLVLRMHFIFNKYPIVWQPFEKGCLSTGQEVPHEKRTKEHLDCGCSSDMQPLDGAAAFIFSCFFSACWGSHVLQRAWGRKASLVDEWRDPKASGIWCSEILKTHSLWITWWQKMADGF